MAKPENPKLNPFTLPHKPATRIPSSNDQDLDPISCSLEKFKLYETRQRFYLIGSDRRKRCFRVLKIDRSEPSELNISEDPVVYTQQEVKNLLQRISEGNRSTGGLTVVVKVYGIAGCIKFLESYYLILVTKRRQIGCICGHAIYSIDESQLITVPHSSIQTDIAHSKPELRYKKLLSSVDLTKDFFYSYTYPIMQSLQQNVLAMGEETMLYENMFVWNAYLTQAIRSRCNNTLWTIALVHGHFKQVRLSIFGREFSVSLISRRSRHFAGTRYLKRGVNDRGRVANDVETEQIILDEETGSCKGKMSSIVQMRGSIPLFWSQEASRFSPKPDIILQRYDPTYQATKFHFEDLSRRYGNPIIVLNLIKTVEKRPREMMLRREFASAVGYLNQILCEECHLKFIHWDFHKFAKSKSANVLGVLGGVASEALDLTGFYYSGKPAIVKKRATPLSRTSTGRDASLGDLRANSGDLARIMSTNEPLNPITRDRESELSQQPTKDSDSGTAPRYQSGVLRTNCIDCLDRTNVAQYAYGLAALGRQLHAMGLTDVPKVDPDSSIAAALMDMYQSMGDALAQQYGGSAAHNTVFPERQGKWKATTQSREFLKSIKRYYSNAYTDGEKQDAINLFLGYFQPQEGKPALWELDSDYYLHVSGIGDEPVPDRSSSVDAIPVALCSLPKPLIDVMGSGFSRLVVPSCFKTAPENHHPDLIFSSSEPWDETLGHSFCYVRSSSPSHSSRRFLSPSHSLRLSETALKTRTAPSSETAFKSISGASVGANTSTPRTILQPDVIYQNATDPLARFNSSGFESSASFSSLPLQPVPRLCAPSDASGPLDRGFFMSGPIERGALSGPLDVATGGDIHFSAPLGGVYVKNRKKKGFPGGSVRKALSRSFSEKKRPWVVPVLNFVGRRDSAAAAEASDLEANSENVQWAHGKAGEDRVHVVVSEDHGWLFVGIYDGFNGPDAPEFLMGHLYRAVFNELEGLFWETIEEDSSLVLTQEEDNRILENAVVVDGRNPSRDIADGEQDCCNKTGDDSVEYSECSKDLSPPPLSCGSVKRVTFESEQKMDSRRGKTLWEFLAEVDEDEGLDLSGSDRFSFSINNLFRVKNGSSVASRRSVLFSKLKFGVSREKESQRKLFPCRFDWEEKEKIEVDNRVEEKLQRSLRRCKVGPADHDSVLSALSRALDITEVSYLEMTDKVLDRNPELALMGSCLLVVLMKDEDVYVMNVGDSRAIVAQYKPQPIGSCSELKGRGKDGLESEGIVEEAGGLRDDGADPVEVEQTDEIMKLTALQLSMDHSTSIEEEVLRIKAEHPDDCQCIVNDRVKGRLKVTRAFGAGFLKQPKWNNTLLEMFRNEYIGTAPYITCSPSLCHHKLGPNDQFLVLSSDGLYQYLSNQEVVSHVENFMEKFPDGDPAQHLIEELLFRAARKAGMDFHELLDIPQGDRRKYHDDVTVMVISLEGRIWKSSGKYV